MLQNRVDPFGDLIATPARGTLMGNRGVIHDADRQIVRAFKLKAWITCRLAFKGRHRVVMTPERWTELFFLDEATAFAAGHRPCAECRRDDFTRFKLNWIKGNPEYNFTAGTSIKDIDDIIHRERIDANKSKVIFEEKTSTIPDGVFVLLNNSAWLVADGLLFLWSPFGYGESIAMPVNPAITVLTPRSVVNAFRAGYLPAFSIKK